MSFRIPRRDTELRFVTKFGENRPLRSCRKVLWITTQKNSGSAGLIPAPILSKMGRSRQKFPERCHLLTCPRIPNLARIGCALPDLFRKDWCFGPKSNYIIGFEPTITLICVTEIIQTHLHVRVITVSTIRKWPHVLVRTVYVAGSNK